MSGRNASISFEYFPPKTQAGSEKLLTATTPALRALEPEFFSVTYGAGGSTRDTTRDIVSALREQGLTIAPHLSFGGDDADTINSLLDDYKEMGVEHLVCLRGDPPSGMGAMRPIYANELVEFVRERTGDHFQIEVAAYPEVHPQAESYSSDIAFLKGKFDAGADRAITQYFYNVESYFYFLDRCAAIGIDKPIIAGVMPIINFANLQRFSRNCGAEIPRWICQRADELNSAEDLHKFGVDVVTQLCQTLLESGAPGIHFYTMNQVDPTREIFTNLGL